MDKPVFVVKNKVDIIDYSDSQPDYTRDFPEHSVGFKTKNSYYDILISTLDSPENSDKETINSIKLFNINSEFNLFESYTEFWATILNSLLSSYFLIFYNE